MKYFFGIFNFVQCDACENLIAIALFAKFTTKNCNSNVCNFAIDSIKRIFSFYLF